MHIDDAKDGGLFKLTKHSRIFQTHTAIQFDGFRRLRRRQAYSCVLQRIHAWQGLLPLLRLDAPQCSLDAAV